MAKRKKESVKKKLADGVRDLAKLSAQERLDIYTEVFVSDASIVNSYAPFVVFRPEDAEIVNESVVRRKPRVFISYSHADKRRARQIWTQLQDDGISVWIDETGIRLGESLIEKIRAAIDSVDVLLALISRNSIDSEWVKKEIDIAMNQEINSRRVKVIPVLWEPLTLPSFLIGKLYADLQTRNLRKKNMVKLVADIRAMLDS